MGKRVIELRGVSIYHGEAAKSTNSENDLILSNIDLAVDEGEFVYLIGRVGTGKSTLLKTLYAEVEPASGSAEVVGFDLCNLKRRQIPELRRALGIVFQDFQLLTDRNVFLNLYDVMRATGWRREEDIRRRIDEVLTMVGLEHKCYKMPFELSGGEQQRLTIARALLNHPRLILADEPTGNLDPLTAEGIMELFHKISKDGCAVVMSTHNISLIEQFPSRTILFAQGHISEVDVNSFIDSSRA
jgi:cell division transport system ATP-binding protein